MIRCIGENCLKIKDCMRYSKYAEMYPHINGCYSSMTCTYFIQRPSDHDDDLGAGSETHKVYNQILKEEHKMKIEIYSKRWMRLFGGRRQWYWRLRADNGKIQANGGEGYYNRKDLEVSLHDVRLNIAGAEIVYL